jgi:nucleotide-binding universal stress UspA family protein
LSVVSSSVPSGYVSIMAPMDLEAAAEKRAKLAAGLAKRFRSRLIGIAARPVAQPRLPGIESIIELEQEQASQDLGRAEASFRKGAGTHDRLEWRQAYDSPTRFAIQQARAADLIVASSMPRNDHFYDMSVDAGNLVMAAGRPVLFVPPQTEFLAAKHVMIAWKNTREARRAVADAIPFLKDAKDVTVTTFGADPNGASDVSDYLTCHGIEASVRRMDIAEDAVAEGLMRTADNEAADLLVCGAYGHSRTREWVFGGVTRNLLAQGQLCCLMSH